MLSWITGARTPETEDELPEPTIVEPPETPGALFAYRALKHAVWGTPAPSEKSSPSKRTGILMTPGTAASRRKQVTFGAQVVDNETNKKPTRSGSSRTGLPGNYPGKFPSPFTPRIITRSDVKKKAKAKLKAALQAEKIGAAESKDKEADEETEEEDVDDKEEQSDKGSEKGSEKGSTKATSDTKKKAYQRKSKLATPSALSDTSEAVVPLSSPDIPGDPNTAEYWKARYESYAAKSERETHQLIKKNKLAKQYAKTKDAEFTALTTKSDEERKRHKTREQELTAQAKDYKERLRQALAENAKSNAELATLRKKIADSETSSNSKPRARSRSRHRKSASPEKKKPTDSPPVDIWEDQLSDDPDSASSVPEPTPATPKDDTKENNLDTADEHKSASTPRSSRKSRSRSSDRTRSVERSSKRSASVAASKDAFPPNRLEKAREEIKKKRAERAKLKENGRPIR